MRLIPFLLITILFLSISCSNDTKEIPIVTPECTENSDCIEFGANYICNSESQKCVFDCSKCGDLASCNSEQTACITFEGRCSTITDCSENFSCNSDGFCEDSDGVIETTTRWLHQNSSLLNKQIKISSNITAIAYSQTGNIKGLYLQNSETPYSGIYIYFITAGVFTFEKGDKVEIIGVLDNQMGKKRIRIDAASVKLLDGEKIFFNPISIDYFADDINQFESMYVNIQLDTRFNMSVFLPQHYVFSNEVGEEIFVKDSANIGVLNKVSLYDQLTYLAGVLDYEDNYRVFPVVDNDILVKTPICNSCNEWENCLEDSICFLAENRCNQNSDCESLSATCDENHYCKLPFSLENGDIEIWNENTPTNFLIGDALIVSKESENINSGNFSAKVTRVESLIGDDKTRANILSPKIAVDSYKNYSFSLFVYDYDSEVDARVTYEIYNSFGDKIGSGIPYSNDGYTQNSENWQELNWNTDFAIHLWSGNELTDIDSIRFGVRLYKEHTNSSASGNGSIYIDNFSIIPIEK
ncbi:hypothetical protein JXR93_09660 [bacterium]|nr:hypothetical protein [bacterium]